MTTEHFDPHRNEVQTGAGEALRALFCMAIAVGITAGLVFRSDIASFVRTFYADKGSCSINFEVVKPTKGKMTISSLYYDRERILTITDDSGAESTVVSCEVRP